MDINEMKLGDILKISSMFNNNQKQNNLLDRYVGKYVICRTGNEGINAGEVVALDDTGSGYGSGYGSSDGDGS